MAEQGEQPTWARNAVRYARKIPAWLWGLAGVLATLGGVFGLLAVIGVELPFSAGETDRRAIERIEQKVDHLPEYLADLDEVQKATLKAAYEEGRLLQLEGYEAQDREKHVEAIDRFTRALALAETSEQSAALHILRGNSQLSVGDLPSAEADYNDAIQIAGSLPDLVEELTIRSAALGSLGLVYMTQGDLAKAEDHNLQALAIHREIGNRIGEAADLTNLGTIYKIQGDLAKAEDHLLEALAIHRETSDRTGEAANLGNLGLVYRRQGDLAKAEDHHLQALAIHRENGNRIGEAADLGNLGHVDMIRGDLIGAEEHYEQALAIHRELSDRFGEAKAIGNLGIVYEDQSDLAKAEDHYQQALAFHREIGDRVGEALQLGNLGLLAARGMDPDEACQLLGEAQAIYSEIGAGGTGPDSVRAGLEELGCDEDG